MLPNGLDVCLCCLACRIREGESLSLLVQPLASPTFSDPYSGTGGGPSSLCGMCGGPRVACKLAVRASIFFSSSATRLSVFFCRFRVGCVVIQFRPAFAQRLHGPSGFDGSGSQRTLRERHDSQARGFLGSVPSGFRPLLSWCPSSASPWPSWGESVECRVGGKGYVECDWDGAWYAVEVDVVGPLP